ncbi:hypothetical protein [Clostridium gasigenes]|uniref:hypothetical protein n=1 Tax=Clostridium gasigenes TaxID=94869 RepID=UPI00209A82FD|nr:hypothetical protein [Clostridium gasigenes]
MELKQAELKSDEITQIVTEQDFRKLLNDFSGYVVSRNIPECKKFIQDFVKEVIVYREHIEVIFNVSFNMLKNGVAVEVLSKINSMFYLKDIVPISSKHGSGFIK